jgi:hypothetical protein
MPRTIAAVLSEINDGAPEPIDQRIRRIAEIHPLPWHGYRSKFLAGQPILPPPAKTRAIAVAVLLRG